MNTESKQHILCINFHFSLKFIISLMSSIVKIKWLKMLGILVFAQSIFYSGVAFFYIICQLNELQCFMLCFLWTIIWSMYLFVVCCNGRLLLFGRIRTQLANLLADTMKDKLLKNIFPFSSTLFISLNYFSVFMPYLVYKLGFC